jgi:peptidyl-prolyl cis-trans isomerase NIMA-interacting 1
MRLPPSGITRRVIRGSLPLLAVLAAGCVVTTLEGPGDPPRVAPPPLEAGRSKPDAQLGESFAEAPANTAPQVISARHLLVMYRGSMRAAPTITRSKEAARLRAEEALMRAQAGEDFAALVAEYSDEPGAAGRGGSLGRFERDKMVPEFSDAAFKLEPGGLSGIVETPFGFHVIQRTE